MGSCRQRWGGTATAGQVWGIDSANIQSLEMEGLGHGITQTNGPGSQAPIEHPGMAAMAT